MTSTFDIQRELRPTNLSNEDIYVTLQVKNEQDYGLIPIFYDEIRQNNLLPQRADKYKMALISLSMPSTQTFLSLWEDNAASITLALYDDQFGGANPLISKQFLQFVPFVVPNSNPNYQRVYLYNQWIQSINNAFKAAFDDIVTQYNAGGYAPALYTNNTAYPQVPPYLMCDTDKSSLFFIKCDYRMNVDSNNPNACIDPASSASPNHVIMQLSMNRYLYQGFFSIPAQVLDYNLPEPADGRSVIIFIYDEGFSSGTDTLIYYNSTSGEFTSCNPFNSTIVNTLVPCFYKVWQQSSTTGLFYDIDGIVVTSPYMQVRPSYVNAFSSGDVAINAQGSTVPINILHPPLTFSPSSFNNTEQYSQFTWNELGEPHWLDIFSTSTFNRLNYQVNFRAESGLLYPAYLESGQTAYITLLFRLK